MAKTKILVTGIGLGKEIDLCSVCNYDLSWLVYNPSVLLWADEIYFSQTFYDSIKYTKDDKTTNAFKRVLDHLEENKLVSIINVADYINRTMTESIKQQVVFDLEKNADKVNIVDDEFLNIGNVNYCEPQLYSIYISVILSRMLNASCFNSKNADNLFSQNIMFHNSNHEKRNIIRQELFNLYLPHFNIFPEYFYCKPEECSTCKNEDRCKDNLLNDIDVNVTKIMKLRSYDELYKFREFLNNKISIYASTDAGSVNIQELKREIDSDINIIRTDINKVIPDVKRTINLISAITIPISLVGLFTSNPILTTTPLVTTGLINGAKLLLDNYKSEYNWISFMDKIGQK